ncbi:MAG: hypothetical protein ACYDCW_02555 [Acidithiobacillus ferrivorans]
MPNVDCTFRNPNTNLFPDLTDSMCGGTKRAPDMLGFALQRHAIGVHRYREREADHKRQ